MRRREKDRVRRLELTDWMVDGWMAAIRHTNDWLRIDSSAQAATAHLSGGSACVGASVFLIGLHKWTGHRPGLVAAEL